jgi:predicted GH43/DUF377 family glycosyl hydrolase
MTHYRMKILQCPFHPFLVILLTLDPGFSRAGDWQLLPFVKADAANPCLAPRAESEFDSPFGGRVKWEEAHVFNPAAVVRDGKVWLLYRAQDKAGVSRLGLAWSDDGLHFTRRPQPVLFPANDTMKEFEAGGGCEDPRVVEDGNGRYVLTYTGYDGKTARLLVATSRDLVQWEKHGPAFEGELRNEWTKSGAIVCRQVRERFVATKINGQYWMYFRDSKFLVAHSDDLLHWRAILDEHGKPRIVVGPRPGKFDSNLVEPGPQALLRDEGVLLLYNGVNAKQGGDPKLPAGNFASGQLLFDKNDPARVLGRSDAYFLTPDRPYEITGQVGNVCFIEGLVEFKGAWFLYYGTADSKIAVAIRKPSSQEHTN